MSYGVFGFGHSTQLVFKGCTPESYLRHSLLPYIQTPKGQRRDSSGLLLPKRMAHPSFIPFRLPAFLANSQEPSQMVNMTSSTGFKSSIDSSSVGTNESSAGVPHLVQNMRRLTAMRSLLDGIDCRHQRVKCLRDIVTGRAEEEIALISLPQEVRRPSTAPSTTYTNTDVEVQLGDETLSLFKWNKQRTSSLQQASGTDLTPSWSTDFSSQTKTSNFPRVTFAEDDTEFPLINQWNRRQTIDSINSVQPLPQHLLFPRGSLQPVNNHDFFFAPRFSKLHTESVRSKTSWLTSRHLSQPKRDI
ncbi:uncharacterized protein LOC134191975 [Corticium candelabrum]|uniref:uncharacterized protein LOC134191975 n=1 Tax=Corticium candelabrum TaxID=121492 RepID=UPI002E270F5A|nr:uncharacterized protein LOC134191975 [Corticium candelabrum]